MFGILHIQGYALLTTGMFFLGGTILTFLGIIGEYVGKTFQEAQGRPLYLVRNSSEDAASAVAQERLPSGAVVAHAAAVYSSVA